MLFRGVQARFSLAPPGKAWSSLTGHAGEHDRCFFSFSLAACLSGEDSFGFYLDPYRTKYFLARCAILV